MLLAEDETDLLLFPPVRATWGRRGTSTPVLLSGRNARRVVFGALNLRTGRRLFLARPRQRQGDFQDFLRLIRTHYHGWRVALLLDGHPSHTSQGSQRLAERLNIELLWLPKRSPELNPMDHLWGRGKDVVSANLQRPTIDEHVTEFLTYLESLSPWEALNAAGVYSRNFWLKTALGQNFCGPA